MAVERLGEDLVMSAPSPAVGWVPFILKNIAALLLVAGVYLGFETGYISSDRLSRADDKRLERLSAKSVSWTEYVSEFEADLLDGRPQPAGFWSRYNGAGPEVVKIEKGALHINYKGAAWLGADFNFTVYKPGAAYRVTVQAIVENQPGAIVVRNRVQDIKRVEMAPSNGKLNTYSATFMAPPGRLDRVHVIVMPDDPDDPVGRMTVRHIKIDRLVD
jgi:hypothetical protein